jgi:hypothetical protein
MSPPRKPHPIEGLSFVADRSPRSRTDVRRCFWNVTPTGDYGLDGKIGGDLAIEYLRYQAEEARLFGSPHGDLGLIVPDMPSEYTGIEIGFFHFIDHAARHGLGAVERLAAHYQRAEVERTHGAIVNVRSDGSMVIEQPDGKRAVYRKVGDDDTQEGAT